jgi:hypothetical protein
VKPIEECREERSLWVVCRNTSVLPPASQAFLKVLKSELSRPIADSDQGSR